MAAAIRAHMILLSSDAESGREHDRFGLAAPAVVRRIASASARFLDAVHRARHFVGSATGAPGLWCSDLGQFVGWQCTRRV